MEYDVDQAIRNLHNVELLGRTECFHEDVSHFPAICRKHGIKFIYKKIEPQNVSSVACGKTTEEQLEDIEAETGRTLFSSLLSINEQDSKLYDISGVIITNRVG